MKKTFLLLFIAAMTAASAVAAPVAFKSHKAASKPVLATDVRFKAPDKSLINDEIIWDMPEGTTSMYSRNCDSFTVDGFEASHEMVYGSAVEAVTTSDGSFYITNPVTDYPAFSWLKAEKSDDKIIIKGANAIAYDYDSNDNDFIAYLVPMVIAEEEQSGQSTYVASEDLTFELIKDENGVYQAADPKMLLGVCSLVKNEFRWIGYGDRKISLRLFTEEAPQFPEGAVTEKWVIDDNYGTPTFSNVYIDGNDIYVEGLDDQLPSAVAKGTITGDKVTFANNQYQGIDPIYTLHSFIHGATFEYDYDDYGELTPVKAIEKDVIEFNYDATNKKLTSVDGYVVTSDNETFYPLYPFYNVVIEKQIRNVNAAPKAPYDLELYMPQYEGDAYSMWFMVPSVDVEGKLIDNSRIYYQVIIDGEVLTFEPSLYEPDIEEATDMIQYSFGTNNECWNFFTDGADHTVYLYENLTDVKTVGVRSVYINENDEKIFSEVTNTPGPASVDTIISDDAANTEYFDVNGCKVSSPVDGVTIVKTTYSNGDIRVKKIIK